METARPDSFVKGSMLKLGGTLVINKKRRSDGTVELLFVAAKSWADVCGIAMATVPSHKSSANWRAMMGRRSMMMTFGGKWRQSATTKHYNLTRASMK